MSKFEKPKFKKRTVNLKLILMRNSLLIDLKHDIILENNDNFKFYFTDLSDKTLNFFQIFLVLSRDYELLQVCQISHNHFNDSNSKFTRFHLEFF